MPVHLQHEDDRIPVKDSELGLPDGDPETVYTLRPLTRETYKKIARQFTTKVPNRYTHKMEEQTDWDAVGEELLDYALSEWTGVVFQGKPVPCEREYKLKLDGSRTSALLEKAGMSQVKAAEVAHVASFRKTG